MKLDTREFIKRSKEAHGNKYDYSKVEYVNYKTKVCIICPTHGECLQPPSTHLRGATPICCKAGNIAKSKTISQEEFVSRCLIKYGEKYSYDKTSYSGMYVKVLVTCKDHGDFGVTATSHIGVKTVGCPTCSQEMFKVKMTEKVLQRRDWNFQQPEDYKLIPLTQGKFAKVDNEDFDRVKDINWRYWQGYAGNAILGSMQNFIMGESKSGFVDHIHHDKLDNRKSQLRVSSKQRNSFNQLPNTGTSSIYIGVHFDKSRNKWASEIKKDGKKTFIGRYDTELEAGQARDLKTLELFKDDGYLNFPELKEEYLRLIRSTEKL